jgi:hypothetical protein
MNWTGGRLSRHSRNAACGLTQRQKQYFAKRRNNAASGSLKRSPQKWAVRAEIEDPSHLNNRPRTTTSHVDAHRKRSQRKGQSENQPQEKTEHKVIRQSPDGELASYPRRLRHREDELHEYDIYNAYSHSQLPPAKRKRGAPSSQSRDSCSVEEQGSVDLRKLRILEKNDWTGMSIQRPIQLIYESAGNGERVCKRRRIPGSQVRQHSALGQQRVASPFARLRRLQSMAAPHAAKQSPDHDMHAEWAAELRDEVRISIGGKPAHTKARSRLAKRNTSIDSLQQSKGCPSDVMLLDDDGLSREDPQIFSQGQEARLKSRFSTLEELRALARSWGYRSASGTTGSHNYVVPHCQRAPSSRKLDMPIEQGFGLGLLDRQYDFSARMADDIVASEAPALIRREDNIYQFRNRLPATTLFHGLPRYLCSGYPYEPRSEPVRGGQETAFGLRQGNSTQSSSQPSYTSDIGAQAPKYTQELRAVLQDGSRTLVVRSSPRKLYHPRPQPSRPKILDSDSLGADSTSAQLGVARPLVPPSQVLDQEIREAWIDSPNDTDTEKPVGFWGHKGHTNSISISPRIGALTHHAARYDRHLSLDIRSKPGTSQKGSERGNTEEREQLYSRSEDELIREPKISCIGQKGTFAKELDLIIPAVDYRNSPLSRPRAKISKPVDEKSDEEKAWKKFVFPSDDESEVETPITPQLKVPRLLSRILSQTKTNSRVKASKRPSKIPCSIPKPPCQTMPNSPFEVHLSAGTTTSTRPTLPSSNRIIRHVTPSQLTSSVSAPGCCMSNRAVCGTNESLSSSRRSLLTRVPSY